MCERLRERIRRAALVSTGGGEYETDQGEYRGGKLNGHAVVTTRGMRFEGEFRDNYPDGSGSLRVEGDTFAGIWSKGCFYEKGKRAEFFTHLDACERP